MKKPPESDLGKPLSQQLESWLNGEQPKTLETLIDTFGDRSFFVITMLFMLLPALPFPTEAHVFEALVILTAAQQIIGLKSLWFPQFLSKRVNLQAVARSKAMKKVIRGFKWLESKSSPRAKWIFALPLTERFLSLIIIGLTLAAFFAPPFSLLDTFPAIGVVLISLSILLRDAVLLVIGLILGGVGVGLWIFFGRVITAFLKHHIFHKR
jgi:hypothetical protein